MKTLLTILVLFSSQVFAQNLDSGDLQDVDDIRELERMEADEAAEPSELPEEEVMTEAPAEDPNEKIQVECQCPPPVQNEEANINSVFPPDTVFFIAPQPAPVPQAEEAKPDPSIPPGYGGKMPSGYSDDTYKQIQ